MWAVKETVLRDFSHVARDLALAPLQRGLSTVVAEVTETDFTEVFATETATDEPDIVTTPVPTAEPGSVDTLNALLEEIIPQRDPRVRENEAYLTILLLSRVVTKLGTLAQVHTGVIEGLGRAVQG